MGGLGRSLAELGHSKLGFASPLRLTLAFATVVVAIALAFMLDQPNWYWATLAAIPLSLSLSPNETASRLYALLDRQSGLLIDGNHFCGKLGEWFVHGERTMQHIQFAESLQFANPRSDAGPSAYGKRAPIGFRYWLDSDIQRIEYDSDKPRIDLATQSDIQTIAVSHCKQRDWLLDQVSNKPPWQKESRPSWRFAPEVVSLLFFAVPLIAFGVFTIATASGFVQVADLPLLDWGDVKRAKGRGGGVMIIGAALSTAFLFMHDNLPALLRVAIGAVFVSAAVVIAYYSCVIKFQRIVWTRSRAE